MISYLLKYPEGEFTNKCKFTVGYVILLILKKNIATEYENGVLSISIKKDASKEYNVEVE